MIRRLPLVAVLIAALTLTFTAVANASLSTSYTFNGHGDTWPTGLARTDPAGPSRPRCRPLDGRRRSSTGRTFRSDPRRSVKRTIDFDGPWRTPRDLGPINKLLLSTTRAEGRAQAASQGGLRRRDHDFTIGNDPKELNEASALVVVYMNARNPRGHDRRLDGAPSEAWDTATFVLAAAARQDGAEDSKRRCRLGSGHSYQKASLATSVLRS